jgi:hypothetical protein
MFTGDLIMFICGIAISLFILYVICNYCLVLIGVIEPDPDSDIDSDINSENSIDTDIVGDTMINGNCDIENPIYNSKPRRFVVI